MITIEALKTNFHCPPFTVALACWIFENIKFLSKASILRHKPSNKKNIFFNFSNILMPYNWINYLKLVYICLLFLRTKSCFMKAIDGLEGT